MKSRVGQRNMKTYSPVMMEMSFITQIMSLLSISMLLFQTNLTSSVLKTYEWQQKLEAKETAHVFHA